MLSILEAVILGLVEGITEFLPVSSTGHLLVVQGLLGLNEGAAADAADTYAVAIQFGAIAAVTVLYRARIAAMASGLAGRDPAGRRVLGRIVVAFVPAAVAGALASDVIKDRLFGPVPVAIAWAIGGVVLVVVRPRGGTTELEAVSLRVAVLIGAAQVLALWPGVSRSLVVLLAALALGLTVSAALEFTFLLGLVTLSAASLFDLVRNGGELFDQFGYLTPAIGLVCAWVTAVIAVRWMVGAVGRFGLVPFGWYRLCAAGVAVALLAGGVL